MGSRFYITGVQLGMMIAMLKSQPMDKEVDMLKILEDIETKQYICQREGYEKVMKGLKKLKEFRK